jgi:hypothetical protein
MRNRLTEVSAVSDAAANAARTNETMRRRARRLIRPSGPRAQLAGLTV